MNLFRLGDFKLHSGGRSIWKIDCDALSDSDWAALAVMATQILPPFGYVVAVPFGGLRFAIALEKYADKNCETVLVADDVLTTGKSMEAYRVDNRSIGVVVFARRKPPSWITALFQMPEPF